MKDEEYVPAEKRMMRLAERICKESRGTGGVAWDI